MSLEKTDDEQLEQMLRKELQPQKPGWEVDREILEAILLKDEKELNRTRYWGNLRYAWIGSLGMVAALAITFVYFTQLQTSDTHRSLDPGTLSPVNFGAGNPNVASADSMQYRAVGAVNKLVGVENNGWKDSNEDSITRELKYDYIDTVDFVNEEDGSVMRMEIPRQEIVNVTYQVI